MCFLQNLYYLQKKNLFIRDKNFTQKKTITEKKNFQKKNFYTENICVVNRNIYLFELYNHSTKKKKKKKTLIIKNIFVKTSWQTI